MKLRNVINVVIIDDHPVFRMGLRKIINQENDFKVIGESEDATKGFSLIQKLLPDIAIIDISLKDSNGLSLIQDISRHFNKVKPLVVSMHDEKIFAQRSLQFGAYGYVMKTETAEVIITALRTIATGNIYISANMMNEILTTIVKKEYKYNPIETLTTKELAILELIGKGKTTREIAQLLHLSNKTIGTYKERIKEKLQLGNAAQLVYFATKWMENPLSVGKKPTIK